MGDMTHLPFYADMVSYKKQKIQSRHLGRTNSRCFNKGYNTAGQALHPPPGRAAFNGQPRGLKPFVSSFARSCACKHARDSRFIRQSKTKTAGCAGNCL
jgi:hypothetical protein